MFDGQIPDLNSVSGAQDPLASISNSICFCFVLLINVTALRDRKIPT